eukprot:scaffold17967_cov20-Tisochrysis_lutea.AAC.2
MRIPYLLVQNALDAMVGDKNVVSMSGQAMVRPVYRRTPQGLGKADAGREQCGLWLRVSHHAVVSLRALYARPGRAHAGWWQCGVWLQAHHLT